MRIAIVDDQAEDRNYLLLNIYRWAEENGVPLIPSPALFEGEDALLENFNKDQYDVVFLDIYMDGMIGINVARKIREMDKICRIVFITVSSEFAVESYDVASSYYIVKPYSYEKLTAAFARCGTLLLEKEQAIYVPSRYGEERLVLHEISYAEYNRRRIQVYFKDGKKIMISMGWNAFAELLMKYPYFCDCMKGILVNFEAVEKLTEDSFLIEGGVKIPISRLKYKNVREKFFEWSFAQARGDPV